MGLPVTICVIIARFLNVRRLRKLGTILAEKWFREWYQVEEGEGTNLQLC